VYIENFIQTWGNMVSLGSYFWPGNVLGKCVKLIGYTGGFYFIIRISVPNDIYVSFQFEVFDGFRFAVVLGQQIIPVEIHYIAVLIIYKFIGKNIFLLQTKRGYYGYNKVLEPIGNNIDIISIFLKKLLISLERHGNLIFKGSDKV